MRAYPKMRARQPARVGADHRAPQGARPLPRAQAPRGAGRRRPARRGGAAGRPSPATTACGRASMRCPPKQRAAVLLRFAGDLSHREVATALGIVGGGRAPQRLRRTAQVATGDDRMTEDRLAPPTFDPADAAAAAARFAATAPADVRLRAGRLARRHAGRRRHAARPGRPLLRGPLRRRRRRARLALGQALPAHARGARAPGRRAPRARRVLRGPPARLRPAHRLDAHEPVRPARAEGHRGDPVRARRHLRRDGRARPATPRPRAPPAARSAPTRSRSSCPAIA